MLKGPDPLGQGETPTPPLDHRESSRGLRNVLSQSTHIILVIYGDYIIILFTLGTERSKSVFIFTFGNSINATTTC